MQRKAKSPQIPRAEDGNAKTKSMEGWVKLLPLKLSDLKFHKNKTQCCWHQPLVS